MSLRLQNYLNFSISQSDLFTFKMFFYFGYLICFIFAQKKRMFIVIACMLAGIGLGYLLRNRKIRFIQGFIITLIWLLLFLLGLEIGSNKDLVSQFGKLGLEAFLLATGGTLGSVFFAKLLWNFIQKKQRNKE